MNRPEWDATPRDRRFRRYASTSFLPHDQEERVALREARFHVRRTLAPFLPENRAAEILDLGCGYGRYVQALQEAGYLGVHGIELSDAQVRRARDSLGLSNVEQADALEWLAGKQDAYDCVLAVDVLEHLGYDELEALVRMVAAALRPGATFIVQVPNGLSPMNPDIYGDVTHVRAFTVKSMRQLFRLGGLEPVTYVEGLGPVTTLLGAIRRILWMALLRPLLDATARVMHGDVPGRLYTASFIAVATRPRA